MLPTYHKLNLVASKGSGVYLYDVKGMRYLDFMAAYGVAIYWVIATRMLSKQSNRRLAG